MSKFSLDLDDENISLVTVPPHQETEIKPLDTTNTMIPFRTNDGTCQTKSLQDIAPEEFMSWVHEVFPYPDSLLEKAIKASGRKEALGGSIKQRQALFDVIISSWYNKWLFTGKAPKPSNLWN